MKKRNLIAQELAEETFRELGIGKYGKRGSMGKYGKLREDTGREIRASDLIYEIFIELINKTDYLLKRTVLGLQQKVVRDEKTKLNKDLEIHLRKYR